MTAPVSAGAQRLASALRPDGQEADRLLREELARAEYSRGLPQIIKDFLEERFRELIDYFRDFDGLSSTPGKIMLLVILGILVVLCLAFVRVRRSHRVEPPSHELGLAPELTGADYRARAAAAATTGNYALACLESFRALVRLAEERTVLGEQPGRTAVEAAGSLGLSFPQQAQDLGAAADLFNEVRYGQYEATASDYARLRDLETTVAITAPDLDPLPAPLAPAAPR